MEHQTTPLCLPIYLLIHRLDYEFRIMMHMAFKIAAPSYFVDGIDRINAIICNRKGHRRTIKKKQKKLFTFNG